MSIFHGVAGKRVGNPVGICFHNDAGSASADCGFYSGWLPNHEPAAGFAHAYVAEDGVLMAEDLEYRAYHCGNSAGNSNYLSIEICQSMGDESVFLENEAKALDLAASWMLLYGMTPNENTVKLHVDFAATSCPHRSQELHGGKEGCRQYFIEELKKRMQPQSLEVNSEDMMCLYSVEGSPHVYWYNGKEVRQLTHPDQITILNRIYKDCHGKNMPSYKFVNAAPWHIRLIQATTGPLQQ